MRDTRRHCLLGRSLVCALTGLQRPICRPSLLVHASARPAALVTRRCVAIDVYGRFLLEQPGVEVNARDSEGRSPLELAIKVREEARPAIHIDTAMHPQALGALLVRCTSSQQASLLPLDGGRRGQCTQLVGTTTYVQTRW